MQRLPETPTPHPLHPTPLPDGLTQHTWRRKAGASSRGPALHFKIKLILLILVKADSLKNTKRILLGLQCLALAGVGTATLLGPHFIISDVFLTECATVMSLLFESGIFLLVWPKLAGAPTSFGQIPGPPLAGPCVPPLGVYSILHFLSIRIHLIITALLCFLHYLCLGPNREIKAGTTVYWTFLFPPCKTVLALHTCLLND